MTWTGIVIFLFGKERFIYRMTAVFCIILPDNIKDD